MGVTKNYIYNTVLQITNILIPFITTPYISRVLGPEGVGIVGFTNSIAQYFVLLGTLGMTLYGNRTIAYIKEKNRELNQTFWNLYFVKVFTGLISLTIYVIIIIVIDYEYKQILFIQSILILAVIFDVSWFFMGMEQFKKIVLRSLLIKILGVLLIFLFVKKQNDFGVYAFIQSFSQLLGQLILWIYLKKQISKPVFILKEILGHLKGTFIVFIPSIAIQIYTILDKTMLGILTSEYQVGIYQNSEKIVKMAMSVVTSIGSVMIPRISNSFANKDYESMNYYVVKSFKYVTYSSMLIFLIIYNIMPEFVPLFFGDKFIETINVIRIISPIIIFIAWSNVIGIQVMIPLKHEKWLTISVTIGALINFPINLVFIPLYGSIGAAIATVIAELSVTLVQLLFIKKVLKMKDLFSEFWKNFTSMIITFLILQVTNIFSCNVVLTILMKVIIGVGVYISIQKILKSTINNVILNKFFLFIKRGSK